MPQECGTKNVTRLNFVEEKASRNNAAVLVVCIWPRFDDRCHARAQRRRRRFAYIVFFWATFLNDRLTLWWTLNIQCIVSPKWAIRCELYMSLPFTFGCQVMCICNVTVHHTNMLRHSFRIWHFATKRLLSENGPLLLILLATSDRLTNSKIIIIHGIHT